MGTELFTQISPLFRTPGQVKILTKIFLDERTSTIAEIAEFSDLHRSNVALQVRSLEKYGWVKTEKRGQNVLVHLTLTGPVKEAISTILLRAAGPIKVIPEHLKEVAGIDELYIVGSWAARFLGSKGAAPHDIDIVLVGDNILPAKARRAAVAAQNELNIGKEVQIFLATHTQWNDPDHELYHNMQSNSKIDLTAQLKGLTS